MHAEVCPRSCDKRRCEFSTARLNPSLQLVALACTTSLTASVLEALNQTGHYLDTAQKTGSLLLVHLLLVPYGDSHRVVLAEISA